MVDPILTLPAFAALERALNLALNMAPELRAELAQQQGKRLRLVCLSPAISQDILLGEQCRVIHAGDEPATACITGELRDWVKLAAVDDKASELINGGLKLSGDSRWLMQLGDAIGKLDIDWEGQLANIIGDVPANLLGRGSQAARELLLPLAELLREGLKSNLARAVDLAASAKAGEHPTFSPDNVQQGLQKAQSALTDILDAATAPRPNDNKTP